MSHIAIDARVINSGTGTYIVKLLEYLQQIDRENTYSVLVRAKDQDYWQPVNPNFTVRVAEFDNYSLAEQLGFKRYLDELQPDLVHFCMPQQPVWYRGRHVTTVHDMTLFKTYNSDKNWLVYHAKQLVGRFVFKRIARTSEHIIAVSETTKREYQDFTRIADDKITVIYESGEVHKGELQPYGELPFREFIMYVGQQPDFKNLRRLTAAHQQLLVFACKVGKKLRYIFERRCQKQLSRFFHAIVGLFLRHCFVLFCFTFRLCTHTDSYQ